MSAPRFSVANNAHDAGKTPSQTAFSSIDQSMRRAHRQGRIDLAMEIHDLPICRFANANIVFSTLSGVSNCSLSR